MTRRKIKRIGCNEYYYDIQRSYDPGLMMQLALVRLCPDDRLLRHAQDYGNYVCIDMVSMERRSTNVPSAYPVHVAYMWSLIPY